MIQNSDRISRRTLTKSATLLAASSLAPHLHGGRNPDRIRVAQIGTQHAHAAGKLASIRKLDDLYELVGVVEPDADRRERLAKSSAYRGVHWLAEAQVLEDATIPVVAVETQVRSLVPTALKYIQAGKHIHLDKPGGERMSAFRRLHAAADERKLTIQMGYMLRYNPAFVQLFQMIDDGWLGELTELSAAMGKKASSGLRDELAQYHGGGMFELACHLLDAVVTALGRPQKVTGHIRRSHPDRDTFADNQLAVLEYPRALATVRCNHLDPFGFPRRHFEVVGEQGFYRINPLEPPQVRLGLDRQRGSFAKGTQNVSLPRATGRYDDEFRDLAKVVRSEKELAWNSEHDLAVHETLLLACGMSTDT